MRKAVNIVWDTEEEGNNYTELPGSVAIPDGIPEDGVTKRTKPNVHEER